MEVSLAAQRIIIHGGTHRHEHEELAHLLLRRRVDHLVRVETAGPHQRGPLLSLHSASVRDSRNRARQMIFFSPHKEIERKERRMSWGLDTEWVRRLNLTRLDWSTVRWAHSLMLHDADT